MSQDAHPHSLSLLSLSIAAASAAPSPVAESLPRVSQATKHRRLSSAGRSGRRRLSDARDAATRPFPTSLQTASASLAALSLSPPTVSQRPVVSGAQPIQVPRTTPSAKSTPEAESGSVDDAPSLNSTKLGRKRGSLFTCESCSKVYRHPSCLIKHRWEHTPQWREASKYVLSKHQQVQLLEAAAILSHLSPASASLPEDRSLWPSFLSGGLVPPPASSNDVGPTTGSISPSPSMSTVHASFPISSSVPATSMLGSRGPRLHDYALGIGGTGVTQIRPGILGVQTGKSSPMPVPTPEDDALNLLALCSGTSVSSSVPLSSHGHVRSRSYSHTRSHAHSLSLSDMPSKERRRSNAYEYVVPGTGFGGAHDYASSSLGHRYANSSGRWSLPRSSVRSKSGSSRSGSHSASESRSDDEDEGVFGVDPEDGGMDIEGPRIRPARMFGSRMRTWKMEDEDGEGDAGVMRISLREDTQEDEEDGKVRGAGQTWDGMDMDMDMD